MIYSYTIQQYLGSFTFKTYYQFVSQNCLALIDIFTIMTPVQVINFIYLKLIQPLLKNQSAFISQLFGIPYLVTYAPAKN